jgi:hypothetical protein
MDPTARLDALADVHDMAAHSGGLVFFSHRASTGRHQNFARRERHQVHRQRILGLPLVFNLDELEATPPQRIDDLLGRSARPDNGQIAIDEGKQTVEVHRAVRQPNPNNSRNADLA